MAVCHADKITCKHLAGGPECWCQLSPGRTPGSRWRVAQLGSPAQHCSRSVATDDNGQFLQEVWMQCSSVIPSSSCCAPGKLQEQFAGFGFPCACWLGHDRHEVDALLRAKCGSVQVRCLCCSIAGGRCQGCCSSQRHDVLPLWGRDGQVKRSRNTVEAGKENIRWAAMLVCHILRSLWEQQPRTLFLRLESSPVRPAGTRCREQQCGEVFSHRLPHMCSRAERACQGCHYTEGTTCPQLPPGSRVGGGARPQKGLCPFASARRVWQQGMLGLQVLLPIGAGLARL